MKKLLLAILLMMASATTLAAGDKVTYAGDKLVGATVNSLVAAFVADTKQTTLAADQDILVLRNGTRDERALTEVDAELASAKSVEVLGSGDAVVVNVITR